MARGFWMHSMWLHVLACGLALGKVVLGSTQPSADAHRSWLSEGDLTHAFDIFEESGEIIVVGVSLTFMIIFVVVNFFHRYHVSFIPESLVVVAAGLLLGLLDRHSSGIHMPLFAQESVLNEKLMNMLFLPVIIFEAGWSIKHRDFAAQLPYILIFAVFGTVVCTCTVSGLILATSWIHGISNARVAFAYGALISAVDPVATLATYAHLNVDPLLNILVMGESIINDAVAIVLFEVLNKPPVGFFHRDDGAHALAHVPFEVLKLLGGSACLGLAAGAFYILILRFGRMRSSPRSAILFIFFSCFFTYSLAHAVLHLSGIITVLFCGMIMNRFAPPHLTLEGRLLASFLLKQSATLADMAIFIFVGFSAVNTRSHGAVFGFLVMAFCLLGRLVSVLPLGAFCNAIKSVADRHLSEDEQTRISWRHLFMMWHAGLRGGIALVLALELGPWVDELSGKGTREALRNATVMIIAVFLLVFGGSTEACLKCLQIPMGDPPPMFVHHQGWRQRCLSQLRDCVLTPVLVGDLDVCTEMEDGVVRRILTDGEVASAHDPAEPKQCSYPTDLGMTFRLFGMSPSDVIGQAVDSEDGSSTDTSDDEAREIVAR